MRPKRVRSSFARSRARIYLRESGITSPPVNVIRLIEKHGKIVWDPNAGNGFTIYYEKLDTYCVFINPETMPGRLSWTLCHELGHIVLDHFNKYDMANLTPREEKILNREADIFVRELLMPEDWVIKYYDPPVTVPQMGVLKEKFDVSWEAIRYRFNELGICKKLDIDEMFYDWDSKGDSITYLPYNFIEDKKPDHQYVIEVNYCTSMKPGRAIAMTVPFKIPRNDAKMRFLECPGCGNNRFSYDASFCKICGLYLFNDCLRSPYDPRRDYENECGRANVANALYCEHCGAKTMLCEQMESLGYEVEKIREIALAGENETTVRIEPPLNEDKIHS